MKLVKTFVQIVLVLSVIAFIATYPIYGSYAARAQRIQLIEYNAANAELLGEPGDPIGSPQVMIIADPKAFLDGKTPDGVRLVNAVYLREHHIYPLQLQTIGFFVKYTRLGCGIAAGFCLAALAWASRRRRNQSALPDAMPPA